MFYLNCGVVLKNPPKLVAHLKSEYRLILTIELKFLFQYSEIYMLVAKLQILTGLAVLYPDTSTGMLLN